MKHEEDIKNPMNVIRDQFHDLANRKKDFLVIMTCLFGSAALLSVSSYSNEMITFIGGLSVSVNKSVSILFITGEFLRLLAWKFQVSDDGDFALAGCTLMVGLIWLWKGPLYMKILWLLICSAFHIAFKWYKS